ncbi:MAG: SUMF1/EgtB/PvdO family nonheme iron enzyme [Acidobacteria bacterium]|nr:SUMF1/EgtB/PvdO family nonheme iron enzyme [Acidobacteriota bacterium]
MKEELARLMTTARRDTLRLFELAGEEHLHESPGFGFRPIIWHLAHIGVFEAYWLLQKMRGESPLDERYERIFDPIHTPREESKNLPSRKEMENFLARVRTRSLDYLEQTSFDEREPMLRDGYVFYLVLEHEYQHQETLAYLLQLLRPELKSRPSVDESDAVLDVVSKMDEMATIEAGSFEMGAVWRSFAYDNELPAHVLHLPAFKIDRLLTTNEEYAQFVKEGGYERREWWSAEGWSWREKENWTCPLYWKSEGREWRVRCMFDEAVWQPTHPVTGVSWYEAEAYARFRGKRLPTEAEWEKAASWDAERNLKRCYAWGDEEPTHALANFHERRWGTTPVGSFPKGASSYGVLDMTGNVWEWTSDSFEGYPGFKYFPYPEYSELWFDGDHRVLKGGSWATRAPLLRTSFRNFFRRHFRIAFAGIRLASD